MAFFVFKWCFFVPFLFLNPAEVHPYYVSVTEVEHNPAAQTLEVSCKIFTDDFEKTLKQNSDAKIDLLNPNRRKEMNPFVEKYIKQHLRIEVDSNMMNLSFLGYEQDSEGIISYFESRDVKEVRTVRILNDLLYDFHPEQIGLMHVTVGGKRKSFKLDNPEMEAFFDFRR